MAAENYYEVLGLKRGARDEDVKQAFRELAKTLHPDRNPDDPDAERRFKLVNTAYEALKDEGRRRAYDEWLAFARKHERSRLAQWARLAAMVVLLVLGPSIALYWAFVLLDGWGTSGEKRPTAAVSTSRPKPAERTTARVENPKEPRPAAAPQAAQQPAPSPELKPDVPLPIARSEVVEEPARPAPPPAGARPEPAAPAAPPPDPAVTGSTVSAGNSAPPQPAEPPREAPAPRAEAAGETASAEPAEPAPARSATQTLRPPLPEQREAEDSPPRQSLREVTGADDTVKATPVPGRETDSAQAGSEPREGSARSMARMMAELKESAGLPLPPSGYGEREQAATRPEPPSGRANTPSRLGSDEFSDCETCPIMSVVTADPLSGSGRARSVRNLAISRSEVTVSEWNACVQDGVCRGFRNQGAGNADKPVIDVSRAEAAQYTDWLSRKTGRPYRLMKVGGWERPVAQSDEAQPRARTSTRKDEDCATPEWEWIADAECIKRLRQAARDREEVERSRRSASDPSEAASGFRVTRSIGPDD